MASETSAAAPQPPTVLTIASIANHLNRGVIIPGAETPPPPPHTHTVMYARRQLTMGSDKTGAGDHPKNKAVISRNVGPGGWRVN